MFDVIVVGAGLSGLLCAHQLLKAGYTVGVLEKSRGLGGRVATRRLHNTCADHGVRCLEAQGELSRRLIAALSDRHLIHAWVGENYQFRSSGALPSGLLQRDPQRQFVAPEGMTVVAKALAKGLEVYRQHRVTAIAPQPDQTWQVTCDSGGAGSGSSTVSQSHHLFSKALVLAIPAPQAIALVEPFKDTKAGADLLTALRQVEFDPCLSAIAGYSPQRQAELHSVPWQTISFPDHPDLAWVGIDSSKRQDSPQPVLVVQSSARFAQKFLDSTDLQPAGLNLLAAAAHALLPWFSDPNWLQVHRWRYAFVRQPTAKLALKAYFSAPLVCCGDWCGGNDLESALQSGRFAANQVHDDLQPRSSTQALSDCDFSGL